MERSKWKSRLNLCCDEKMYRKIKRLAQKQCLSVSSLVRQLLAEALRREEADGERV